MAVLHFLAITLSLALFFATAHAQRAIPDSPENEDHFNIVKEVIGSGALTVDSCEQSQEPNLLKCIELCNSPGTAKRGDCCCATVSNDGSNANVASTQFGIANFGLAGSCIYVQQLLNYTINNLIKYKSLPVENTSLLYYDQDSCKPQTEGVGVCTCSISWSIEWSNVNNALLTPTPSKSFKPKPTPSSSSAPGTIIPSVSSVPTQTATPTSSLSPIAVPVDSSPSANTGTASTVPTTSDPVDGTAPVPAGPNPASSAPVSLNPVPSSSSETDGEENGDGDGDGPVEESGETESGGVCVDERYLLQKGYTNNDMVHTGGLKSTVWCPEGEGYEDLPCGTEFHKVRMLDESGNGGTRTSVSYRQLCEDSNVKCRKDLMKVNSVWTDVWEDVDHGRVSVTMFDVRYSETAQKVLHRVMRSVRRIAL